MPRGPLSGGDSDVHGHPQSRGENLHTEQRIPLRSALENRCTLFPVGKLKLWRKNV